MYIFHVNYFKTNHKDTSNLGVGTSKEDLLVDASGALLSITGFGSKIKGVVEECDRKAYNRIQKTVKFGYHLKDMKVKLDGKTITCRGVFRDSLGSGSYDLNPAELVYILQGKYNLVEE